MKININSTINKQVLLLKRCFGISRWISTSSSENGVPVIEEEIQKRLLNPCFKLKTFERLKSLTQNNHTTLSGDLNQHVHSAVLMPFCFVEGELSLLFIIRSPFQPSHAGQVGFPGGNIQTEDSSFQEAALRETYEELGIPDNEIEVWTHVITSKEFAQRPLAIVLGFVKDFDKRKLDLCHREVQDVFTLPLIYLLDPTNQGYTKFRWQMQMPVFTNRYRNVWGMTSMFTNVLLKALFPELPALETFVRLPNLEESHT